MRTILVRRAWQAALAAALFTMSACDGCGPGSNTAPVLRARDTFMLAYVTANDNIHVRNSDNGLDWVESTGPGGNAIGGVGAAASVDAVGATRLVAYRASNGKLRMRFSLGTETWETQESEFADQNFFSQPAAIHADGTKWLLSTTDGQGHAAFSMFDASNQQFVNQTPAGLPGTFQNDTPGRTPAMARIGTRLIAAWPRFNANGSGPTALQFVHGTLSGGSVQWERGSTPALAVAGLDTVVSGPALAQDGTRFYAAIIRKSNVNEIRRLFVWESQDGLNWQRHSDIDITSPGTNPKVGIAARPDGSMAVIVLGDSDHFFLRRGNAWNGLSVGNVFGTDNPSDDFALIGVGQQRVPLFVNRTSTATPPDGTEERPFLTIARALAVARAGDTVVIQDNGLYQESQLRVPRGVTLRSSSNLLMPVIRGATGVPLLTVERNVTMRGLQLDGGQNIIALDLGAAFQGQAGHGTASGVTIEDCKIGGGSQGAIKVTSPNTLVFGDGNARIFSLTIRRNWFTNNIGGNIVSEVVGPETGVLALQLDISDNVVNGSDGIRLQARGRGSAAQPARTFYTGRVFNNLIFGGGTGITLDASEGGEVGRLIDPLAIRHNTINASSVNGIVADAQDNNSRVRVALTANIISNSMRAGWLEFSTRTTPSEVRNNLFFQNGQGHVVTPTAVVTTVGGLNGAPVNGSNNLVADPRFEVGSFRFSNAQINSGEGDFFLRQGGQTPSPAVDAGPNSAAAAGLATRSTRTDYVSDTGTVDIGFHYRNPT
jgi:hypothetical protein